MPIKKLVVKATLTYDINPSATFMTHAQFEVDGEATDFPLYALNEESQVRTISDALLQAILVNIRKGHQEGFFNDAKHMHYVVTTLGKGFALADISPVKPVENG